MVRKYGQILQPGEMPKKDPNCFPAMVLFAYKKSFEKPTRAEGFSSIDVALFERKTPKEYVNKALILDYDGTLRQTKSGDHYPTDIDDIEILPGRREKLQEYVDKGYLLLGVSNQSGVEKGNLTWEEAASYFDRTNELLGHDIDFKFCPHHSFPIRCFCRKPMTGLGVELIETYKLDPSKCIMVGDMKSDNTFANRCGFQYISADEFFIRKGNK
jgi:HAD superfamily hydrolase (TIGR01662 family)